MTKKPLSITPSTSGPSLSWDIGTAYDLFASLFVLHEPEQFGLRGSWAAGVRSRLSTAERQTLEQARWLFAMPFHWIYSLPEPKDAAAILRALRQVPAEDRLATLAQTPDMPSNFNALVQDIAIRKVWNEKDLETLRGIYRQRGREAPRPRGLISILEAARDPAGFGEAYLAALQTYYESFFAEEELHIASTLEEALANAQELAHSLSVPDLLERLSQGVHFEAISSTPELVLVPSYWSTPLVFVGWAALQKMVIIFGARPENVSLVPGEVVPDLLLRILKAMADPTRLRILRYLTHESLTPAELARRLRLRAPTVTHHLTQLRSAGLVHLMLGAKDPTSGAERRYIARQTVLPDLYSSLEAFLSSDQDFASDQDIIDNEA